MKQPAKKAGAVLCTLRASLHHTGWNQGSKSLGSQGVKVQIRDEVHLLFKKKDCCNRLSRLAHDEVVLVQVGG